MIDEEVPDVKHHRSLFRALSALLCLVLCTQLTACGQKDTFSPASGKRYEQEQGENAKKIKALRLELKKDESKRMDIDDFLEKVRRYTDATTITKRMVAELIDHIEVYYAEKQDGITNQRVVIHYNCIGAFDVPSSPEDPVGRHDHGNKKRRSTQLRPGTGCGMSFSENKKAECPLQDTQIL